jgi:hypothetical protein
MNKHSTPRAPWLRRSLLPLMTAVSFGLTVSAEADTPTRINTRIATPLEAPPPPAGRAGEEGVLIMVCRRGLDAVQTQQSAQDLPMLCLATQVSEEAAQLGPARFRELLDKAASAGAVFVVVVRPE